MWKQVMKEDRKFYRRHWTTGDMKLFEWIAETRGYSYNPEDEIIARLDGDTPPQEKHWERCDKVKDAMTTLSQNEQLIVLYYYHEGKTLQRIADLLGYTVGTIHKKRAKALEKLRVLLEREVLCQ